MARKPAEKKVKIQTAFAKTENQAGIPNQNDMEAYAFTLGALKKSIGIKDPQIEKAKTVFVSKSSPSAHGNFEHKGNRRLLDQELRDLSIMDPYISAIISTRTAQALPMGRPAGSRFEKGARIVDLDPPNLKEFKDKEQYATQVKIRKEQTQVLLDWLLNCGSENPEILDEIYKDADKTFKECKLYSFISCQVRNLLTFGRCATHIIRDVEGNPIIFRPVPVETIYRVKEGQRVHISKSMDVPEEATKDADEYNALPEDERPMAYVQILDGQQESFFTADELFIWNYQDQALADLNGYPLSPIEQALFMVFIHQQTLQYMRNQFVKGMASKGMICLESTSESTTFSDDDLEDFRQQFHNFVSRNDNSATVPVIAGQIKANFIPLNANPDDMQFLQIEDHIIRAICAAFQIAPQELLQSTLGTSAQGGLNDGGKDTEIIASQERGLRIVLDVIFDGLNHIMGDNFPEMKKSFRVVYSGIGSDTKDAIIQQSTAELQTTATMSSLWSASEKTDPFPFGGDAPLAPSFWTGPARFMTFGEIREHFFGDTGAASKPEYQFLVDPNLDQQLVQRIANPIQAQTQMAQATMSSQMEQMEVQTEQMKAQAQQPPPGAGQPQPDQQGAAPQPAQKSLKDSYRETMQKSMTSYFGEWLKIHGKE